MKILISGASGFLGQRLCRSLSVSNQLAVICHEKTVFNFPCESINLSDDLERDIQKFNPDFSLHLAASYSEDDVQETLGCNTVLPARMLKAISKLDTPNRNFICIGSYWQHGCGTSMQGAIDLYSASKLAFSGLLEYYASRYAINSIELVLYGVYSEDDHRGKLINLILESAKSGRLLELSPGEQMLNLVHVKDVISGVELAIQAVLDSESGGVSRYRLSSGNEYSVKDLISLVESCSGLLPNVQLGAKSYRSVEVFEPVYMYPILPGWRPTVNLESFICNVLEA
ncbi:NAD-dependent epimerase/dehydratase family protein [Agaribacterium sp. ZY112]|uniref:NAD-dependent epimerase/dehydratase family protein n=1 Tax=Agaribacterium sp. ZY112 TaxID=3233574 RepID=UPI00352404DE